MPRSPNWSRDEVILAMNLYTRLDFGQFHSRNPLIIQVADKLGRTPGALALKLSNLASLDPFHQSRGIKGMANASKLDHEVWDAFQEDWKSMGTLSEERMDALMQTVSKKAEAVEEPPTPPSVDTETIRETRQRLQQQFFRRAVLTSYRHRCCITGNPIPELLTASHILPWAANEKERLNPANGLCLAKTQDAAFDRHLITLDEDYRLVVSNRIRDFYSTDTLRENFARFEGQEITLPERFRPRQEFLEKHREAWSRIN